jgi:hypothetical protein
MLLEKAAIHVLGKVNKQEVTILRPEQHHAVEEYIDKRLARRLMWNVTRSSDRPFVEKVLGTLRFSWICLNATFFQRGNVNRNCSC